MPNQGLVGKFHKLSYALNHYHAKPFYGFVQGHAALSEDQLANMRSLVCTEAPAVISEFETRFAALVGDVHAISFAAARMAFFAMMKALGVGAGDEVILLGANCAVMANAVLRAGATPVYSDIDPETFGSSASSIESRITPKTRIIVAQHSFGIPCDIRPIAALARARGIFLLEDCALAVGSKVGDVAVGNFGDAALFSTDHSKPLNTLTGGLLVTKDADLAVKVRGIQVAAGELPAWKQQALWQRLLFERKFCHPLRHGSVALRDMIGRATTPPSRKPILDQDFGVVPGTRYPYPARMPAFLAAVGIAEIQRWHQTALERKALLRGLLDAADGTAIQAHISPVYRNRSLDIVPLRLAWTQEDGEAVRASLSGFVDTTWTWFLQPLIAARAPLESYSYQAGSCPVSEHAGPGMVNLPCAVPAEFAGPLIERFRTVLSSLRQ